MKWHRTLSRAELRKRKPSDIALMIASELLRAASRSHNTANVRNCYGRARELMGVLETIPLPQKAGWHLQPYFRWISNDRLQSILQKPSRLARISAEIADDFTRAAQKELA